MIPNLNRYEAGGADAGFAYRMLLLQLGQTAIKKEVK